MLTAVNVKQAPYFVGSSKSPAENTAAAQAALDTNRSIFLDKIQCEMAPGLVMRAAGQAIFGLGPFQTTVSIVGEGDFIETDGRHDCAFFDFMVRGYGKHTGGSVISATGNAAQASGGFQVWGCDVRNVVMDQCWNGIFVEDVNSLLVHDVSMRNMLGWAGIYAASYNDQTRTDIVRISNCQYSAHAEARTSGRGYGLVLDGQVHTVTIDDFNIVGATVGVDVRNSTGLPFGKHVAFIESSRLKIDFPSWTGIRIAAIDTALFHQLYVHGSEFDSGVALGAGVRNASITEGKITGHAKCGIYSDADDLQVMGCNVGDNAKATHGHPSIMLGHTAWTTRLIGNVAKGGHQVYGVTRPGEGQSVVLVGCEHMRGVNGVSNW